MKVKTSELSGAALDWAAAKAADYLSRLGDHWMVTVPGVHVRMNFVPGPRCAFSPSTRWAQGGPIIEIERIKLEFDGAEGFQWWGYHPKIDDLEHGPTPLVAAMRCFVLSRFGDEVDVPEEFKE